MTICTPSSIAVISVNYKNATVTLQCIEALLQLDDTPKTIVIVDNASGQQEGIFLWEAWRALASRYHRIAPVYCTENDTFPAEGDVLLVLERNQGFSAGNNAALRRLYTLRTDYNGFWLLNNDAFPQNGALAALCSCTEQSALVGSTLVYSDEPTIVQCAAGGEVSSYTGATRFVAGGRCLLEVMTLSVADVENKLDYINGASLLIHREVLERIGFLPDEYFLYYEDVDFCTDAKRAGFRLGWAQQSIVLHMEGASSGINGYMQHRKVSKSVSVEYYSIRNRVYFMKKFYPQYIPTVIVGVLYSLGLRIYRRNWRSIKIIFQSTADALCGKMRIFNAL